MNVTGSAAAVTEAGAISLAIHALGSLSLLVLLCLWSFGQLKGCCSLCDKGRRADPKEDLLLSSTGAGAQQHQQTPDSDSD